MQAAQMTTGRQTERLSVAAAFAKGWDITLVVCSVIPILLIVTSVLAFYIGKITTEQSESYGVANGIASEALAAIRTVLSFNGEDQTVRRYGMSLQKPMRAGIKGGLLNGLIIGFPTVPFCVPLP